jgi:ABC-2 type transport system ATP-binding protein
MVVEPICCNNFFQTNNMRTEIVQGKPTIEDCFMQLMRINMTNDKIITAQELSKRFGHFTAVDAITFDVYRGEIFGFLGANGAGKTTAMRMLCGLSKPTGGKATVAGFDVYTQNEQIKKNIGYMSQKFSLYEDLTVKENMQLYGGIYGKRNAFIKEKTALFLIIFI